MVILFHFVFSWQGNIDFPSENCQGYPVRLIFCHDALAIQAPNFAEITSSQKKYCYNVVRVNCMADMASIVVKQITFVGYVC